MWLLAESTVHVKMSEGREDRGGEGKRTRAIEAGKREVSGAQRSGQS